MPKLTANEILSIAYNENNYIEKPVNDTKFGRELGINPAQWCYLFVRWCFKEAGHPKAIPGGAYTPAAVEGFKSKFQWHTKGTPKAGDLLFFDIPNDGVDRVSHVGLFVKECSDGTWLTIEGNTSPTGDGDQRNGGQVAIKKRPPSWIVGWGRPNYEPAPTPIVPVIRQDYRDDVNPPKKVAKKSTKKAKSNG
jgi:hypothetical protein